MTPVALAPLSTILAVVILLGSSPTRTVAATALNPADPSNFTQDGGQMAIPGVVLKLVDQSVGDVVLLFANDTDALPGVDVDVVATFQVTSTNPNNVDVGNRVVIDDATRAVIAECLVVNGIRGIGLLSQGQANDPASYPVFVPVDWQSAPCTIRLRRTANGDAELVEVNGVAPSPRALLTADRAPAATRPLASVEFGCGSPEARCTVQYSAFRSERVSPLPVVHTTLGSVKARYR